MSHAPQGQQDAGLGLYRKIMPQIRQAAADFLGQRPVQRRHAAHGIGDAAIEQLQIVPGMTRGRGGAETVCIQGFVKQLSGVIAGKGSSRGVGAMQARCEPDNEQPCILRTKRRDGRIVIVGVQRPVFIAKGRQSRTQATGGIKRDFRGMRTMRQGRTHGCGCFQQDPALPRRVARRGKADS